MSYATPRINRLALQDPPTGAEADRRNAELYQRLWQERGVVAIDPEQLASDWDRQFLIGIAEQKYGKRGTR